MPLTKDQIRQIKDRLPQAVEVPEWEGSVFVRALSGIERDAFETAHVADKSNFRGRLVAAAACDENGVRLFEDSDAQWLGQEKSSAALDRIVDKAMEINGIGGDALKDAEKLALSPWRLFLHRLALAHHKSICDLLACMDSLELTDWLAFYELDPWGDQRADLRSGIAAAALANHWRTQEDGPAVPNDFMPDFESLESDPSAESNSSDDPSPQELSEKISAIFSGMRMKK